jgi:hypothetical protein
MTRLGVEPRTYGLKVPSGSVVVRCNALRSVARWCAKRCEAVRYGAPRNVVSHCEARAVVGYGACRDSISSARDFSRISSFRSGPIASTSRAVKGAPCRRSAAIASSIARGVMPAPSRSSRSFRPRSGANSRAIGCSPLYVRRAASAYSVREGKDRARLAHRRQHLRDLLIGGNRSEVLIIPNNGPDS